MTAMHSHLLRRATLACALSVLLTSLTGCGQKGPLTLPEPARPIERLPTTTGDTDQPSTEPSTDENEKKERTGNER
jgi:predicted small lipoprotein YifL